MMRVSRRIRSDHYVSAFSRLMLNKMTVGISTALKPKRKCNAIKKRVKSA